MFIPRVGGIVGQPCFYVRERSIFKLVSKLDKKDLILHNALDSVIIICCQYVLRVERKIKWDFIMSSIISFLWPNWANLASRMSSVIVS